MALTSYVKVTGDKQGDIKGGCTQSGDKADAMLIYGMEHKIEIPRDTHTGLATGQRIHHPYTILKAKDVASPKLMQACCTGEGLTVTHEFYLIDPATGAEKKYYTVKLEEALAVQVEANTPATFLPENKPYHDMEKVSFTYSKITATFADGNIEYTDSWKGE